MKSFLVTSVSICLAACSRTTDIPITVDDQLTELRAPDGRTIPLRVLTPSDCTKCPLVIFSHGAFSAYDRYDALLLPLATSGFKIAAPNHVDSEEHMDRASFSPEQSLPKRLEDYEIIAATFSEHPQFAIGHSYGAMIAQLAGGAELSGDAAAMTIDAQYRPKAVIAISPPGPIKNYMETEGWAKITTPSLVVTGTEDVVPKMTENWEDHLVSYTSAPSGTAYALVYSDMDHYMNGSYGRVKEVDSAETIRREKVISHLNAAIIDFIKSNDLKNWSSKSSDFVDAKSR